MWTKCLKQLYVFLHYRIVNHLDDQLMKLNKWLCIILIQWQQLPPAWPTISQIYLSIRFSILFSLLIFRSIKKKLSRDDDSIQYIFKCNTPSDRYYIFLFYVTKRLSRFEEIQLRFNSSASSIGLYSIIYRTVCSTSNDIHALLLYICWDG